MVLGYDVRDRWRTIWAWFKFHQQSEDLASAGSESDAEVTSDLASKARKRRQANQATYLHYLPLYGVLSLASVGAVSWAIRSESFTLVLLAAVSVTVGHFALRKGLRERMGAGRGDSFG